ncbi:MAG: GAF domain-containing protein [Myxococcota bacterium]|jgi:GAF domain-containing protein
MSDDQYGEASRGHPAEVRHRAETVAAFVEIVEALVGDFDLIEVLTALTSRVITLLDVEAAGVLLADSDGCLRVIGASNEAIELLELFQIQNDEGPCLDCFQSGEVVLHSNLNLSSPWPLFSKECTEAGFASVCAVPMRLQSRTIGCLNMFLRGDGGLTDADVNLAQAFAHVATVVIMQDEASRTAAIREGQLSHALTSRIAIEQAKGMIAERFDVEMDEAFARLRSYSQNNNVALTSLAQALVAGTAQIDDVTSRHGRRVSPPPGDQRTR